jgi:hypothetical protein
MNLSFLEWVQSQTSNSSSLIEKGLKVVSSLGFLFSFLEFFSPALRALFTNAFLASARSSWLLFLYPAPDLVVPVCSIAMNSSLKRIG